MFRFGVRATDPVLETADGLITPTVEAGRYFALLLALSADEERDELLRHLRVLSAQAVRTYRSALQTFDADEVSVGIVVRPGAGREGRPREVRAPLTMLRDELAVLNAPPSYTERTEQVRGILTGQSHFRGWFELVLDDQDAPVTGEYLPGLKDELNAAQGKRVEATIRVLESDRAWHERSAPTRRTLVGLRVLRT